MKIIGRHVYSFNNNDNGGEQLLLKTEFIDNKDEQPILHQKLTLNSYCNSASFDLGGILFTPKNLRELANELESAIIQNSVESKPSTTLP